MMNNVLANLNFFRRNFSQLAEANYRIRLLISIQRFLLCIKLPAFFTQCWRKAPCTKVFTPSRCVWFCEVLLKIVWRFDCHRTRANGWHAFWLRRNYNVTMGSGFFFSFHFNFSVHGLWSWLIDTSYAIMFWIQALHSKGI